MWFAKPKQALRLRAIRSASNVVKSTGNGPRGPGRPARPFISTLNPLLLEPSDYIDLSGIQYKRVHFDPFDPRAPRSRRWIFYLQTGKGGISPFPDHCAGFLYYHSVPGAAIEGSLRFRIAADATRSSFSRGHDLLLPSGVLWQRLLPQLTRPHYKHFCNQLLHEDLVTPQQISQCREIFGDRDIQPSLTLFHIGQEFPISLDLATLTLTGVGESLHRRIVIPLPSYFDPGVFTGSLIARFEPSTVGGHRIVQIRITKIITPIVCTVPDYRGRIVEPKEGQLLTVKVNPVGHQPGPWKYDLERESALGRGLRALWAVSEAQLRA
ncbi:hypothetical protein B0H16DRAFT_1507533 [Mycena metata]|uniref:Uncharacterized protein n=1 Tax=Mycena metata TaxID=1033252 RepID=A0AAD7K015_9AGAR|nr:hypothetical protein B0H16DRAFT_1507533 [Mycena metata]